MWGCHGSVSTVTKYTANKAKTWNGAYASAATYHKFEGSVGTVMEYTADQMKTEKQLYVIAPVPLSSFAGEETSQVGKSFIKSFIAVCIEGAIIVLACIIYSKFATTMPSVNASASAISQVWSYIGEILFNMLVLVGTIKLSDQVVNKMMGV